MSAAHVFDLGQLRVILESAEPRSCYEIPILDGSALQWCETLPKLNLRAFDREVWICVKKHRTEIDGKFVEISPGQSCYRSDWNCHVEFGSKLRESKYYSLNWVDLEESREQYIREIAPARTFAFRAEIEALKKMGLGLGGSLDNALVIDGDRVINPGGYRVESELATHKLLDAIGDFALLGRPIIAQFDLFKAGHQLHLQALKEAVEAKAIVPAILSSRGEILAQSEDL